MFGLGEAAETYYSDSAASQSQTQETPPPLQLVNERLDELQQSLNTVTQNMSTNISREEFERLVQEHKRLSDELNHFLGFMRGIFIERGFPPPPPPNWSYLFDDYDVD